MAHKWREVRIEDLGRVVTGQTPPKNDEAYYGDEIPFLTPTDLLDNRRVEHTGRSLSSYGAQRLNRSLVPRGVGVSCIGWQMGKAILIDQPTITNQQINSIIIDNDLVDRVFVYYSLAARRSEIFNMGAGGSRTPILNKGDFERLPFVLPPLSEQRAIAHILSTLDDKIELNRRMNGTLVETARALFKSWFVDFDPVRAKSEGLDSGLPVHFANLFPDKFDESELGLIPRGWQVKELGEFIDLVKGRSYKREELVESDTALVTLKSFARGGGYRPDGLKSFAGTYKPEQVVKSGEIVIACTDVTQAAEVIGRPAIVGGTGGYQTLVASLDTLIVRPRHSSITQAFLYFLGGTETFVSHTYAHTTGTTVLHLGKEAVSSFKYARPPVRLVEDFDSFANPVLSYVQIVEEESRTLVALRDALLPKLISGELPLTEAERFIGENY